jgi:hypothetical protein
LLGPIIGGFLSKNYEYPTVFSFAGFLYLGCAILFLPLAFMKRKPK